MSVRIEEDIVQEAARLADRAPSDGIDLRILGGIAVHLRCPEATAYPRLRRSYRDIDLAAPKRAGKQTRAFLEAEGYEPNQRFNALHGASRLLFYDHHHHRQVDVFLGTFSMCHKLDLEPRIPLTTTTLPVSDLLLLKLQIIELNEKDILDAVALLLEHEPAAEDDPATISTRYIATLGASDWGWFTTLQDNLQTIRQQAQEVLESPAEAARVAARIDAIIAAMDSQPKPMSWRLRDRVGRRKIWYELPDEVEQ
jgi:hypothetical protein